MALHVDNIKEVKVRCEKAGCGFNLKPTVIEQLSGMVVMLIVEPNVVEIEIIQD